MVTTVGTESTLEDLLRDLIQLEQDAKDAYQAAIDRLENADFRTQLAAFREDHLRHIEELGGLMAEMGREPPKQGDMKSLLTKGKVVLAGLVGDKAILLAMKTNEDDTAVAAEWNPSASMPHDAGAARLTLQPQRSGGICRPPNPRVRSSGWLPCGWRSCRLASPTTAEPP